VLDLLPESARVEGGELTVGGLRAGELADRHGTPLLVYCEQTITSQVRAYREAAPGALIVYGTKAFANVALLRLLADLGVGADASTLGELAFARAAGIPGERIVFHGNNKSEEELPRGGRGGRARRPRRSRRGRGGGRGGVCVACSCG
jgi:diaminopimelate decarboxylase